MAPFPDGALVQGIQESIHCSYPFALLLARRGGDAWRRLIDPDYHSIHPPTQLFDMPRAVDRLLAAIEAGERIFIHGDFDVDGLSGAAVLYRGLRPLLPPNTIKVEVGSRSVGHGISRAFVLRAIEEQFQLVVTTDCGVSAVGEIADLRAAGIDTIVTDHHLPPDPLPDAVAIVNPHRSEDTYPNRYLAGVGVAFKLICGLYERLGRSVPLHLLDLVALGTIADLVPLSADGDNENRGIVREAFERIARGEGSSLGLRALMSRLSINPRKLSTSDIGYLVAPKLNAANRAGDPKVAFLLLITEVDDQAEYLAEILLDYNRDREIAQNDLIAQAEEMIRSENLDPREDGLVFIVGPYWNEGLLGLVASNLADRYRVPTIVVSRGDRVSRGSCRSVGEFDINACLDAHADLLLQYGGHKMAAGFSVNNDTLPHLEERLFDYVTSRAGDFAVPLREQIDAPIAIDEVDGRFHDDLSALSPFGPGNPTPRFLLPDCSFSDLGLVGNRRQHLKGRVVQRGVAAPFIAFRMGRHLETFEQTDGAALVCHVGFDDWRGVVQVQGIDLVEPRGGGAA